jgi:hypothetical protein
MSCKYYSGLDHDQDSERTKNIKNNEQNITNVACPSHKMLTQLLRSYVQEETLPFACLSNVQQFLAGLWIGDFIGPGTSRFYTRYASYAPENQHGFTPLSSYFHHVHWENCLPNPILRLLFLAFQGDDQKPSEVVQSLAKGKSNFYRFSVWEKYESQLGL